jgi:hypothetical protein
VSYDIWTTWRITLRVNQLDVALAPSSVGSLSITTTTGMTAANPFGTLLSPNTANIPAGLGLAYDASNSYVYARQSYVTPALIQFIVDHAATVVTFGSGATAPTTSSGLSLDTHASVGTNQTDGVLTIFANTLGATTSTANYTAANYWNGSVWTPEPTPSATVVRWYMGFHYTTLTTPTQLVMHVLPITPVPTSLTRQMAYLRHHPSAAANVSKGMCSCAREEKDPEPQPDSLDAHGARVFSSEDQYIAARDAWRWRHQPRPRMLVVSDDEAVAVATPRAEHKSSRK